MKIFNANFQNIMFVKLQGNNNYKCTNCIYTSTTCYEYNKTFNIAYHLERCMNTVHTICVLEEEVSEEFNPSFCNTDREEFQVETEDCSELENDEGSEGVDVDDDDDDDDGIDKLACFKMEMKKQ